MAKENDININVKTPGTPEARQQIGSLAGSVDNLSEHVDKNTASVKAQGQAFDGNKIKSDGLIASIGKWALGLLGVQKIINEVTKAIQLQTQAMEENARIAESQQKSVLRLQLMGDYYKERPELRREVQALSEYGRRPFEEVAGAYYNLRSNAGNLTGAQQSAIMQEALQMGRTDPAMPLDTLINMFSLYAKLTGSTDMNRVQNVLTKTIEMAGGTGADVANYMPQFLPVGLAGGLSGAEAAGLWSYVTTQQASPSIATTGLRATFLGLQGKGTPEGAKLLQKYGITDQMNFQSKISVLSGAYRSGQLDLSAAEQIAGREGASIFLSLLQNPQAMEQSIAAVTGADRGNIDLVGQSLQGLMGSDEVARREENIRLLNIKIANQRANDPEALRLKEYRLDQEHRLRQKDFPEYEIVFRDWLTGIGGGVGVPTDFMNWKPGSANADNVGPTIINNNNSYYNQTPPAASERSGGGIE